MKSNLFLNTAEEEGVISFSSNEVGTLSPKHHGNRNMSSQKTATY